MKQIINSLYDLFVASLMVAVVLGGYVGWCYATANDKPVVINDTARVLARVEGYRATSYKDGKRYSIGYGTQGFKGQKISKYKAFVAMTDYVRSDYDFMLRNYGDRWLALSSQQQVFILSVLYQRGRGAFTKYYAIYFDRPDFFAVIKQTAYAKRYKTRFAIKEKMIFG